MTRLRLLRWSGSVLSPRTRPEIIHSSTPLITFRRYQATATASVDIAAGSDTYTTGSILREITEQDLSKLPSPPVSASQSSAKLAALHARLTLPSQFPVETLARTLIDSSADPSPRFNNKSLSVLGSDLLGYYTSEYIICQYPRLPLAVVFAAMYAYVGPKALTAITREWGVEYAAEPGGEVDPGFLQFRRLPPEPRPEQANIQTVSPTVDKESGWRRGISSRSVYDDEFGDLKPRSKNPADLESDEPEEVKGVTAENACTSFVRALVGAIYLHAGRTATKQFYCDHFMSRQLNMANLFQFRHPARDLNRLCAREGFQSPVARILSETGRKSRHPVFVVGVYSGNDKLGEGAGSSLDEARTRAAVAALKGWYLYSPVDLRMPSEMEEPNAKPWTPTLVDYGDIVT